MSIKQFTQKQNIQMLWDLISDEEIFRFLTPDIQTKIYDVFMNNIQGFFEVEKKKINLLVELNKKYILLILNHIRKNYPYQPSKITIYNEPPVKELITFEEIQNDRKSQFEKDFSKRQEDFEDSMTIKAPPVPEFSDKETDKPIKEMDKILKEMQAQRKYEVEQINRVYNNSNQVDNWLKPQETSLKSEKFQNNEVKSQSQLQSQSQSQSQNNRFKFLNELDQNFTSNSPKKNVSFSNNDEIQIFNNELDLNDEEDDNIFSKLKKVKKEENIILQINEPKFNEQNITDDRISKLERTVTNLNDKIDKILHLLSKNI